MAKPGRTAPVVAYYSPKLSSALSEKQSTSIYPVLRALAIGAWLAGTRSASAASQSIADGVTAQGIDLGAPADAGPEWAETAELDADMPDSLANRLSDLSQYSDSLIDFDSPLSDDDQASQIASTTAIGTAEDGAQASYSAGGVEQWDLENDSDNPCPACEEAAAGGPYDVGSGPEIPLHDRCECESVPVTDDSEGRSFKSDLHERRTSMPNTSLWSDEEWRKAMSTKEINDLPDSDFAYIEPGGEKDDEGKTTPRSLRHYPIHDEAHVKNALARAAAAIAGDNEDAKAIAEKAMPAIKAAAKKMGIGEDDESKSHRAAGDNCNRCDGEGTIRLNGDDVECPQCGGTGSGDNNGTETQGKDRLPATAIRAEMRGVPETRVSARSEFELREVPNGTGGTNLRFTGFASVTDAEYEMEDWLGPWTESVNVGAFGKTLSEGADVAFLLNHQGMTLARTKPGTLKLSEVKEGTKSPVYGVTGLHSEALLDPTNMYVQAMRSAVDRGDLDEMSFGFRVTRQEWNEDYTRRWIAETNLDKGDVSLVNYGANDTTGGTVAIRQRLLGRGHDERAGALIRGLRVWKLLGELREGKVLSGANEAKLQEALSRLHDTDDADLPAIVRSLQDVDAALDDAQAAVATVLGTQNPDGDPGDLEPALVPPSESLSARLAIERSRQELLSFGAPR